MSSKLFDRTIQSLGSSVNLREIRHNITLSNIANAETPGYKAKKVDFEDALSRAVQLQGVVESRSDDPDHFVLKNTRIENVAASIYDNPEGNTSNDANSVDLEKEMSTLAKNSIMYKAAVQLINKKLANLKYSIREGR
jgi:flagellar basal-body rod protein FlgB